MADQFGRISGPLLANNLLRDGVDLSFETNLLYLDVNNAFLGVNTDTPTRTLTVNGTTSTVNLLVDTQADLANFTLSTNTIRDLLSTITISPSQATNPIVATTKFQAGSLQVSNQLIQNITANSDINLSPTGKTVFNSSRVNVNGTLHATGNITFDGDITFGNANTDNVTFSSDINSDLIPNIDNTYNLGSLGQEWATLYSTSFKATNINTAGLTINSINLLQTPGKTLYVSVNGNDTYYGTHQHSTFKTIKYALSQATSGDTIVIFPGIYTEIFPLTVPQGVAIKGAGIRSVNIQPTVGTKNKNAFLLNGDTTIEFLTVQNFFYDSVNNTGYAFAFAPNFKAINRSPYIYNVTVITKGSVTSPSDPLGFTQGDAGGGIYLDGSLADPTATIPPTGLFFSVTLIVPNQNGITGTNGVRIEWLNSFSYFAKRGIYLLEGTLGRAGQATVFGAEMRSINSANVYGTYGAVADGAHTLAYLIGHNFGYIGTDADSSNDPQLVIQANEVDEINNGHIYYDSQDHRGDFRIGSIFWVEQSTGNVTFNANSINFGSTGSIVLEGPSSTTIIDKNKIQTGNIRVHDNTIDSLVGPVQFLSASGKTYLNTNVFVTGNLGITGDGKVSGNVFLGNSPLDIITIYPQLTQDILPDDVGGPFSLGSDSKRWNTLFGTLLDIDGITQISNNTLTTLTSGTNLQFTAAGTGIVYVPNNDVAIDQSLTVSQDLTVNGTTSLKDTVIRTTTLTPATTAGAMNYNANGTSAYFFRVYGPLHNDPGHANFDQVQAGWTCIQIPGAVVVSNVPDPADNNESCVITITGGTFVQNTFYSFTGNVVTYGPKTLTLVGDLNQTGNAYITGLFANNNIEITGSSYLTVPNLKLFNNEISATSSNSDLNFVGTGTAGVILDNRLKFKDNIISNVWSGATTDSQKSIIFSPNGTGNLSINTTKSLVLPIGNSTTRNLSAVGELRLNNNSNMVEGYSPTGRVNFMNVWDSDRNTYITPELTPGANDNTIRFGINGTVKATVTSAVPLYTNTIYVDNVSISGNSLGNLVSANDLEFTTPSTGNVVVNSLPFNSNTITNITNGALTLASTGIGYVKFSGTGAVRLPIGPSTDRRALPEVGEIRNNTTVGYMEVFCGDVLKGDNGWIPAIGTSGAASEAQIYEIMDEWTLILG